MEMHLDIALQNLHCKTPTDPSGTDEPYLWIFHIIADGTTIRQRTDTPFQLSANIVVQSGGGRPGNLNEAKASSGSDLHIPPSIGEYQHYIKSIVLDLPFGSPSTRVFIPGRLVTICAALDEESVPRDAMEAGFNVVKTFVQNTLNDFFNGLSLAQFESALKNPDDPIGAATTLFNQLLDAVISQIEDQAPDIAESTATDWVKNDVDWWNPFSWAEGLAALADKEEQIGSRNFTIDERSIISSSLHQTLLGDLRQSKEGLGGAWYVISGYGNATMRFAPGDHTCTQLPPQPGILSEPELHHLQVERPCVDSGTIVTVQRTAHSQQWQIVVNYPFIPYQYTLDGQELVGDSGTLRINKTVHFPEFDENKFYFLGSRSEVRMVSVNYQRLSVPGIPQLHRIVISNDPADGNYDVELNIVGLFPNGGTIPVTNEGLTIVGQTVGFPDGFLDSYIACVARTLSDKWLRVKKTIPDRWYTPEIAWSQYEEIDRKLTTLQSLQALDAGTIQQLREGAADQLKVDISQLNNL